MQRKGRDRNKTGTVSIHLFLISTEAQGCNLYFLVPSPSGLVIFTDGAILSINPTIKHPAHFEDKRKQEDSCLYQVGEGLIPDSSHAGKNKQSAQSWSNTGNTGTCGIREK